MNKRLRTPDPFIFASVLAGVLASGCATSGPSGGLGEIFASEEEQIRAEAARDHFPTAAQAGIVSRTAGTPQ